MPALAKSASAAARSTDAAPRQAGRRLHLLEAVHVALAQVRFGATRGDEFGHGFGHAGRMGDPHGLRDVEAVDLGGLPHEGAAVRGEGKDAVEPVLDLTVAQPGQQVP